MMSIHTGSPRTPQQIRHIVRKLSTLAVLLIMIATSVLVVYTRAEAASTLVVQYANANTSATANAPSPHLEIVNNTSSSVTLSSLTIRYWYTEDGTQAQQFSCDYAVVGCSNVTGSFVSMATPTSTADTYLQVGFSSTAGSLAAGGNTGDIQTRFNKTDWSNFNQANDYSWNQTQTTYAASSKITLYLNGQLVWGSEPNGTTAPTPTPIPTAAPTTPPTPVTGGKGGWTTSGTKILAPNGSQYIISGINWYGFETPDSVVHGLWSFDISTILNEIKANGYNTIRMPYSNQMWESDPIPQNVVGCSSCANLACA